MKAYCHQCKQWKDFLPDELQPCQECKSIILIRDNEVIISGNAKVALAFKQAYGSWKEAIKNTYLDEDIKTMRMIEQFERDNDIILFVDNHIESVGFEKVAR